MKNLKLILILFYSLFFLIACEDTPPVDYTMDYYVEAYLFVNQPVQGLKLYITQPYNKPYSKANSWVKDADVRLITGNDTFRLDYKDTGDPGYFLQDDNYKVLPETMYRLEIKTKDGRNIWGETLTPQQISWTMEPKPEIYYPKDTLKLPVVDSLKIAWNPAKDINYYFVRVTCHDTVYYGRYFSPQTTEMNRRCYNLFSETSDEDNQSFYKNTTNWGFIANTSTNTVWLAFKWFGKHEVSVLAPDKNLQKWFVNLFFTNSTTTEPNLNSVHGGFGCFGSASIITKESFLYKNQP